ncbi:thermonuclease family protein [Xanthomonas euvesicatoria pv. eucalypti]|uniref:thermonuclease family protein n=1 Tax=Xanthomonas euvesicatoria TaxID=456327 RepID=UPI0026E21DC1|nr:thermonuclease family protein [Xanthomonas euvesicatoria]MDO7934583.1 thermonuclease family protein [Xanthomonas euvesicatoria pv. eucalypti]MDO7938746.1 thermonuclease family protein [Xanthomonas euvesicatoria pv. eucalypti]MDO7942994.1 thermonuclease family protein [Xanthomonas euvesicatoria pv. eucalypti]MDO7947171.1 thermonuclease family protein [Xanthomonas euvesicatoria pv. eucalypti]MDO7951152.1 thermonuclease family protein [Xanthomonas euvesicatoria pv. eucalypti]
MVLKGLAVLLLAFSSFPSAAAELVGRATVTDGDTLTVAKQRIRPWGIDAPESAQQCTTKDGRSWPCGRRSAAALDSYVLDKTVRCQPKDTDRYGRVVAECFVQGQSINRWMVRSGCAVAYRQYATAFIADEADARQHQRNLWQGPFQMPADYRHSKRDQSARQAQVTTPPVSSGCRIKGNISRQGKKIYHVPGQRDYERTSIDLSHGERMFCSPVEALRAGWQPAKR